MTFRTHYLSTCGNVALLLLALAVNPTMGQTDEEQSSRRIAEPNVVKTTDAPQKQVQPEAGPSDEVTRIASNNLLQPLEPEPARITPTIKKFPKLADPEKFRVKRENANRKWISLQDNDLSNQSPQDSGAGDLATAPDDEEFKLLKRLPVSDLNEGIVINSMQRAVNYPDIPNPNLSFVESAALAPTLAPSFQPITKTWRSPNMVHRPLYFEDANLERYGNGIGKWQPVASGVHFFSSVMMLPYKIGTTPPTECDYSMGHFRPGNCVPAYRQKFECNPRGTIYQGLAIGALMGL